MTIFRIATCKPAETLERAERLRELTGNGDAVVAPSFRKNIRVGRLRRKQVKVKPVLGGVIFIAEGVVDLARGPGGICACRSAAAAVGGVVPMLTPWKDPVTGDREYATAREDELVPLIEYAKVMEECFDAANLPKVEAPPPLTTAEEQALIGKRAVFTGGLMLGMVGVISRVSNRTALLILDAGTLASSITVPVGLLKIVD